MITDIPDYAEVMTLEDFVNSCKHFHFVDDDGIGYYANPPTMNQHKHAVPSVIRNGVIESGYTHIAWFNK